MFLTLPKLSEVHCDEPANGLMIRLIPNFGGCIVEHNKPLVLFPACQRQSVA